jgi:hypothetical protein
MRCLNGLLFSLMVLALVSSTGRGSEPAKAPVAELIRSLGSEEYEEREAATKTLGALGAPALDALRKASLDNDSEVRRRASALVQLIESRLETASVTAPQKLRLQYKDVPLTEALADLGKKSGFALKLLPDKTKADDRKVTLDTGEVTTWEAFDKFCAAAGLVEIATPTAPKAAGGGAIGSSVTIIGGARGAASQPTDIVKPPAEEKKLEIALGDGKPTDSPTHYAGALRVRLASADAGVPNNAKNEGEALFALEVLAENKLVWQKAVALRVSKALDENGVALAPLPVTLKMPAPAGAVRSNVVINGTPIVPPEDISGPESRLVPVRLRQAEKPAKRLKELTGTIVAQVKTEAQTLVAVDNVLKSAGQTVKGPHGGSIRVLEVVKQDGNLRIKVQVETAGRGLSDAPVLPFGGTIIINGKRLGEEECLSSQNFALVDAKGKPFRVEKAVHTGVRTTTAHEYEFTYLLEDQGEPTKFEYRDRRVLFVEVPFTLKDVTLP